MYIIAASTISHQPTFRNKGFSRALSGLKNPSAIVNPDYSSFISAMERRRMSDVLKMSITCASDCLQQAKIQQPGAIIVGTSMGCCAHTKNFLDKIIDSGGGLISPTSFISSTHNTIAGQISLLLKNHNYNMTHTQNSLSFEQALMDGILCINEGCGNALVGAADEIENELYNIKARLNLKPSQLACGASFFILSSETKDEIPIRLMDVGSFGLINNISEIISDFLKSNKLSADEIDLVLYSASQQNTGEELSKIFGNKKLFDYQIMSGIYFINSAFAMNYGIDILSQPVHPVFGAGIKRVLICNNLIPENLGLILLDSK